MKTQISVLVKNESIISRMWSFIWFIKIFKKTKVNLIIDNPNAQPIVLTADKEPYLIDVAPGPHEFLFTDPGAASKKAYSKMTGALIGASVGLAMGGSFLSGAMLGADAAKGSDMSKGYLQATLYEGDVLKVSAQATRKGNIKLKMIKDSY